MSPLSSEQVAAIRRLKEWCHSLGAEPVIIGAIAYLIWIRDWSRHTADVDAAVAMDLDELQQLSLILEQHGWTRHRLFEHRWYSTEGARIDLLPAGPELRRRKVLQWPVSGIKMSLVGFEHVFTEAVSCPIEMGLDVKVIPPAVLLLLKIVAYLENSHMREKDIDDVRGLLMLFEPDDELRFSAEVAETGLEYELVGAYWMGRQLGRLCDSAETALVEEFLHQLQDEKTRLFGLFARNHHTWVDGETERETEPLIRAFALGFRA